MGNYEELGMASRAWGGNGFAREGGDNFRGREWGGGYGLY